ncbi:hypothetical protein VTP01DRAFT_6674 [Rhizomucor pusillus]|uniref:uncharacterized protein n=1 Tax=Rhizomucor pusillus TaxID=4840 RepID=UPI00374271FE
MPRLTIIVLALVATASVFANAAPSGDGKHRLGSNNGHHDDGRYRGCLTRSGRYDSDCLDEITKRSTIPGATNQGANGNFAQMAAAYRAYDEEFDQDGEDSGFKRPYGLFKRQNFPNVENSANNVNGVQDMQGASANYGPYGQLTPEQQYWFFRESMEDLVKRATPEEIAEGFDRMGGQYSAQFKQAATAKAYREKLNDWATKRSSFSE